MADKALLVGINEYPGAPLAGCLNDVVDMAHFITELCGFDPLNVRMLTDLRATTSEILKRLDWLVDNLHPGDRILFQYSGHGAQMASRSPAGEVDGLDEVICPVDFDWTNEHAIRDDQFHEIFDRIPAGVQAIWVSDSCHSGDLVRDPGGLGGRRARRLVPPTDLGWRIEAAQKVGMTAKGIGVHALPNIVLISGCKSDQTSADASFGGRANGALTYFLLNALKAPGGQTTALKKLVPDVVTALKRASYDQTPQLEGPEGLLNQTWFRK